MRVRATTRPGASCPLCKEELGSTVEEELTCPGCQAGYHQACLKEFGGTCATLGCKRLEVAKVQVTPAVERTPEVPSPRAVARRSRLVLAVIALVLLVMGAWVQTRSDERRRRESEESLQHTYADARQSQRELNKLSFTSDVLLLVYHRKSNELNGGDKGILGQDQTAEQRLEALRSTYQGLLEASDVSPETLRSQLREQVQSISHHPPDATEAVLRDVFLSPAGPAGPSAGNDLRELRERRAAEEHELAKRDTELVLTKLESLATGDQPVAPAPTPSEELGKRLERLTAKLQADSLNGIARSLALHSDVASIAPPRLEQSETGTVGTLNYTTKTAEFEVHLTSDTGVEGVEGSGWSFSGGRVRSLVAAEDSNMRLDNATVPGTWEALSAAPALVKEAFRLR